MSIQQTPSVTVIATNVTFIHYDGLPAGSLRSINVDWKDLRVKLLLRNAVSR
jgi:hypothetical protein